MEGMNMLLLAKSTCDDLLPIIRLVRQGVFPIFMIGIPIILIIMGSIDLGKAVLSSDDKEIKAATGRLIKRFIAAVAVFFIVWIVQLVIGWASTYSNQNSDWKDCWDKAAK